MAINELKLDLITSLTLKKELNENCEDEYFSFLFDSL